MNNATSRACESNLVLHSTVMLHREYFPFLPTSETVPRGPVDHPKLQAEAPPGWWDASALEMFNATEHIARILHEASECASELLTPFVGFCAFSAAYMNLYVFHFPQMNLGRSRHAEENLNYCLAYLETFRQEWKLGESWVSRASTSIRSLSSFPLTLPHEDDHHQACISSLPASQLRQSPISREVKKRL